MLKKYLVVLTDLVDDNNRNIRVRDLKKQYRRRKMKNTYDMRVSEEEKKLLELIKSIKFGQLSIKIQNSKPVRVEEHIKSIKL